MRIFIITFRSVTFAQRGERLLNRNNHRWRPPEDAQVDGAAGLRLQSADQNGRHHPGGGASAGERRPLRKIYAQRPDGNLEELTV